MARKRPHVRRLLFALLILVLIALLLEINRWLPGGLPGGGGDGGFRERPATTTGTEDDGRTPQDSGALTLTAPGDRPTPEVTRGGVVVQVRSADGTWLDYRIGAGGAAVEPPRGKQLGTHELKAKHALAGELRIRTKDRAVAHDPQALGAEEGAWVVVLPAAASKVAGRADRVTLDFAGLEEAPASFETEDVAGKREQHKLDSAAGVSLPPTKRPQRVRLGASETRPASPWYWVHPRDGSTQSIPLDAVRRLSMGAGLDGEGVLQEVIGPGGSALPFTTGPGAEAGVVYVRAPKGAELVGRFRIDGADLLVPFWDGFADQPKQVAPYRSVRVRVTGTNNQPAAGAQIVATWQAALPGAKRPEPVRLRSVARPTGTPGEYELRLPLRIPANVIVASEGTQAVDLPVPPQHEIKPIAMMDGRSVVCTVKTPGGTPVQGAQVYAEEGARSERVVRHGVTDPSGQFELRGMSAEPFALYAKAKGMAWARTIVQIESSQASLTLETGAPLRLLVSTPNGRPVPGVTVDIEPESPDTHPVLPPAPGAVILTPGATLPAEGAPNASGGTTGSRGELVIPDLPAGLYTLRLHHDGMHEEVIRKVEPGARTWFLTLVPKR